MDRIYIDGLSARVRTALKENGELTEIIYEQDSNFEVGNIYAGRVTKVLKGQFAFIDIGDEKNAFLQPDIKKQSELFDKRGKLKLKEGDSVPVQIIKTAVDEKGAVVGTRLNFTGKYCVLIANDSGVGISKKITDEAVRDRLKSLAAELIPDNFGLIMRTDCQNVGVDIIRDEIDRLKSAAFDVLNRVNYIKPPHMLYKELDEGVRVVRDLAEGKDTEVITNSPDIFDRIKQSCDNVNISLYGDKIPLFDNFGIESGIEKALHKKIWLKSGGYLVFDYTEAMNVIDVNSGKQAGKSISDLALKVNLEAAAEAAKQIRLRGLTGMIIIDFINMQDSGDVEKVSQRLKECIARDRITTSLVGMTSLGLMQLTRKKTRLPLHKILMRECPTCAGSGITENEFYVCDKIMCTITSLFAQTIYKNVCIKGSAALSAALHRRKAQLDAIADKYNAHITFEEITVGKLYYYEIEKR